MGMGYRAAVRGGLAVAAGLAIVSLPLGCRPTPAGEPSGTATARYLAGLDVRRFERRGTAYTDPLFSPLRLGKPLGRIDVVYDYDFPRLEAVARSLEGVDRRAALAAVFGQVTRGCRTDTERHLAVLKFLHRAGQHNELLQPMWPDGTCVFDPLILLELGEMRCGQVNRVAVDLFRAAGYDGRLVQVAHHVSAEVSYGGGWHYFDGDIWGDGESVVNADGSIPSVYELSRDPARLDGLTANWEPDWENSTRPARGCVHPSWYFFAAEAYREAGVDPVWYVKTATPDWEGRSRDYGWEVYETVPDPGRVLWDDLPRRPVPACPVIDRCDVIGPGASGPAVVELGWRADPAADGYTVFIGRTPRGWNFDAPDALPPEVRPFRSSARGWRSEDYAARFTLPPADVARVEVAEPRARAVLPAGGGPVYVTVMAWDAYGRAAGRWLFPMSEELRLDP